MSKKKRGLGRGLDALFEDEEKGTLPPEEGYIQYTHVDGVSASPEALRQKGSQMIGIDQAYPNADQPRKHFDEEALSVLAESIKVNGIIQPIIVRQCKQHLARFEIIAGERRWRAAQMAGIHDIPVMIKDFNDEETLRISLIENLHREDLNPMEEARTYQRMMDDLSYSQDAVAKAINKSRSYVANMTRLLTLPESVQNMVANNQLSAGHAKILVSAKNPALLAQEILSKNLSVRQAEKLAAHHAGRNISTPKKGGKGTAPEKDADTLALEKEMYEALGFKTSIDMKGAQNGSITVEFKTLDQLDDILKRLSAR